LGVHRGLADAVMHLGELALTEHVEAALLSACHHEAVGKFVTKLCGKNDAALVVQSGREGTEKHPGPPSRSVPCRPRLLHFPPPVRLFMPLPSSFSVATRPFSRASGDVRRNGADARDAFERATTPNSRTKHEPLRDSQRRKSTHPAKLEHQNGRESALR